MASNLAMLPEPHPLRAVTVPRDVQAFDLLIEDMEAERGGARGDLDFAEALVFLKQDDAARLEFVVIAVDETDEDELPWIADIIRHAKRAGLRVILVAKDLGPMALHALLRAGADDFVPYPLPENALAESVARIRLPVGPDESDVQTPPAGAVEEAGQAGDAASAPQDPSPTPEPEPMSLRLPKPAPEAEPAADRTARPSGSPRDGAVFAIQSASGGDGATTIAVNLAWDLATISKTDAPRVCIIDLGLQFGSVATYLDLPRKPMIYEVLSDVSAMDEQAFRQALVRYRDRLDVFTAPAEILPLDLIGAEDVTGLLALARNCFDIVIVDMPATVTGWTDAVIRQADLFFVVCGLEVRSAQNALRFHRLLQAEGLATERLAFLLNRAPGKMDMSGRGRVDRMAESLGIKFHAVLPDGGKQVTEANDQAVPLGMAAARNGLTKEIHKLAQGLLDARRAILSGEAPGELRKTAKRSIFGLKFG